MLNENQIIPYHATKLTGHRVMVFAPHPDDETFGCGGSLYLHSSAGDPVKAIFLTNGAAGDVKGSMDRDEYITVRRNEAIKACHLLGIDDTEFLGFEDRELAGSRHALSRIIEEIKSFRPELIYAPSALDFHPDHRAAHFLVCYAVKSLEHNFDIAFYEVTQLVNPNCLVDITAVAERKFTAADVYQSQLKEKDYKDICKGLNRYRALTLSEGSMYAEAYFLIQADTLRKSSFITIYQQGLQKLAPTLGEVGPLVSVIVRTKNRPELLANALKSIVQQTYSNLEIVLVNDGGIDVTDLADTVAKGVPITYLNHKKSQGRSAAANAGLHVANGHYITFLDDDDILYPDHLETLVSGCYGTDKKVVYSNVKNVYFNGSPELPDNLRHEAVVYNYDFNPALLLFFKYIPIMSLLFERGVLSRVDGFSESLKVFEDWDFLIRLSRHYKFYHIDKVTAEFRMYHPASQKVDLDKGIDDQDRVEMVGRWLSHMSSPSWIEYVDFLLSNGFDALPSLMYLNDSGHLFHQKEAPPGPHTLKNKIREVRLYTGQLEQNLKLLTARLGKYNNLVDSYFNQTGKGTHGPMAWISMRLKRILKAKFI